MKRRNFFAFLGLVSFLHKFSFKKKPNLSPFEMAKEEQEKFNLLMGRLDGEAIKRVQERSALARKKNILSTKN